MTEENICKHCGKPRKPLGLIDLETDQSKYCYGFHLVENTSPLIIDPLIPMAKPIPVTAMLIDKDIEKIRTLMREELTAFVAEQERKLLERIETLSKEPPELASEHDGKLDSYSVRTHAEVAGFDDGHIWIHGGFGDITDKSIYLDIDQFESLMQWGRQNRHRWQRKSNL